MDMREASDQDRENSQSEGRIEQSRKNKGNTAYKLYKQKRTTRAKSNFKDKILAIPCIPAVSLL